MTINEFWNDELISEVHGKITGKNLTVVYPEGADDRTVDAMSYLKDINAILLGNGEEITSKLVAKFGEVPSFVQVIDEANFFDQELLDLFVAKRNGKVTVEDATAMMKNANYFATLILESGRAHALVGGSVYSTADILKPSFQIVKPAPGNSVVSSCFILKKGPEQLIFADCAVNIEPNKDQLKEITLQSIDTAVEMGLDPKVAMLSYSTKGSGTGHFVDLVREAYEELIAEKPELKDVIDGELQFDAAYVEAIGASKAPGSSVAGKANVFIFPHLVAGNIGYKLVQQLGGYEAVGPLLQGLNKPVNDLSRGCDAPTIAKLSYLALRKY